MIDVEVRYGESFAQGSQLIHIEDAVSLPASGLGFFIESFESEFLPGVTRGVIHLALERLPGLKPWIFVGNRAWVDKSRITLHYRLWRAMKISGLNVPASSLKTDEVRVESHRGYKFFGAFELGSFDLSCATHSALERFCFYVVLAPGDLDVHGLLCGGWNGGIVRDAGFLHKAVSYGCLVLGWVGGFGDKSGLILIGGKAEVSDLKRRIGFSHASGIWRMDVDAA